MFEASVDGEAYDVERFGQYYRPYGVDAPAGSSTSDTPAPVATPAPTPAAEVVEEAAPAPVAEAAPEPAPVAEAPAGDTGGKSAEDILAMIRSRQKA